MQCRATKTDGSGDPDGYGHREERQDNAILNAGTPVMDRLWREQPHTLIAASGLDVGLPDGQMGNSEVGHVNFGRRAHRVPGI